jgi:hypothetical protein
MLDWLFNDDSEQDKETSLFDYGLNEDECKVMAQDMYSRWNFDEEDLEEDDYYVEDEDVETSLDLKTSWEKSPRESFFDDDEEKW